MNVRARDLEVARLVLEGAAKVGRSYSGIRVADAIRALEVRHHE